MRQLCAVLLVFLSFQALADTAPESPNPFECFGEPTNICKYHRVYRTAGSIRATLEEDLFFGFPLYEPEGKLFVQGEILAFWHQDPAVLNAMKNQIVYLDRPDNIIDTPRIYLSVEAVTIKKEYFSDFMFSLQNISTGLDLGTNRSFSNDNGTLSVGATFGSLSVGFNLKAQKQNNQAKSVTKYMIDQEVMKEFSFRDITPIHEEFALEVHEDSEGMHFYGVGYVDDDDKDLVKLEDFFIKYGIRSPVNENEVRTVQTPQTSFSIRRDEARLIVGAEVSFEQSNGEVGITGLGRGSQNSIASLVLIVRAYPVYPEEIRRRVEEEISDEQLLGRFSPETVEKLPSNPDVEGSFKKAFQSLTPRSILRPDGEPVLAIHLDRELATQENYRSNVQATISIGGKKWYKKLNRSLENLMTRPMALDLRKLPSKWLNKSEGRPVVKVTLCSAPRNKCIKSTKTSVNLFLNLATFEFTKE